MTLFLKTKNNNKCFKKTIITCQHCSTEQCLEGAFSLWTLHIHCCRRRLTRPGIITSSCCSATPRRRARRTRARGTTPRSTKPSRLSRTLAKRFGPSRFSITRLKLMSESELSTPGRQKIRCKNKNDIYFKIHIKCLYY